MTRQNTQTMFENQMELITQPTPILPYKPKMKFPLKQTKIDKTREIDTKKMKIESNKKIIKEDSESQAP